MTPLVKINKNSNIRSFNAPHRTGLVDFPHPALQSNSPSQVIGKSCGKFLVLVTDNVSGSL